MYKSKSEIEKIILRAKKLFRMSNENSNEGEIARNQLEKLKEKWKLTDEMIAPIYEKEMLLHDKNMELDQKIEILLVKCGKMCGNEVSNEETPDMYKIIYRGNDYSIEKSQKIIDFLLEYTETLISSVFGKNLPTSQQLSVESIKLGFIMRVSEHILNNTEAPELVKDKQEIQMSSSSDVEIDRDNENTIQLVRSKYDEKQLLEAARIIDDSHLLPVLHYVKTIIKG